MSDIIVNIPETTYLGDIDNLLETLEVEKMLKDHLRINGSFQIEDYC